MAGIVAMRSTVEDMLVYGLGTYVVLLTSFLVVALPFAYIDSAPWLRRRCRRAKIQPDVHVSDHHTHLAVRMVCVNFAWLLPVTMLAGPVIKSVLLPPHAASAPWWRVPALLVM